MGIFVASEKNIGIFQELTTDHITQGVILLELKSKIGNLLSDKTLTEMFQKITLLMVKMDALGTLVSCSLVIFFSPSKSKNDSNVGGAFIVEASELQINHYL